MKILSHIIVVVVSFLASITLMAFLASKLLVNSSLSFVLQPYNDLIMSKFWGIVLAIIILAILAYLLDKKGLSAYSETDITTAKTKFSHLKWIVPIAILMIAVVIFAWHWWLVKP